MCARASPQKPSRFSPGFHLEEDPAPNSPAFAFHERRLLVRELDGTTRLPRLEEIGSVPRDALYLGQLDGRPVLAWELGAKEPPSGTRFLGLRRLGLSRILDEELWALAGRAV